MDQISLPMRIALVVTLLFASIWFVVLRPKPVEDVDGPLPTVAAAEQAAEPKAAAEPAAKPDKQAAQPKADKAAEPKAAKPAAKEQAPAAPAKGPKAVLADIAAKRTVVLLFWDPEASSSDDRLVRRAVSDVDRRKGSVRVHLAEIDDLAGYESITKVAPVEQTPTVFVIDRKAQVHRILGLTVTREIDALVDRTRAAGA